MNFVRHFSVVEFIVMCLNFIDDHLNFLHSLIEIIHDFLVETLD